MPWEKGKSGNPKGRPKAGLAMSELIVKLLEAGPKAAIRKAIETQPEAVKRKWMVAEALVNRAIDGDTKAIQLVLEYMEGKPTQRIEATTESTIMVAHEDTIDDKLAAMRHQVLAAGNGAG